MGLDEALALVHSYAGDCDDFLTIKKELLKLLPPTERQQFSIRDPITKKQRTNDFERQLAARWSILTGRPVIVT